MSHSGPPITTGDVVINIEQDSRSVDGELSSEGRETVNATEESIVNDTLLSIEVEEEIDTDSEVETESVTTADDGEAKLNNSATTSQEMTLDHLLEEDMYNEPQEISIESENSAETNNESKLSLPEEEPQEFEDNEIAKALKALDQTSYVEEEEFSSLVTANTSEESKKAAAVIEKYGPLLPVPGDRRDFFFLTVAADKTPLATQKWGEDVHVISPLTDTTEKEKKPSKQRIRSSSTTSSLKFTRNEEGELALDLRRASKVCIVLSVSLHHLIVVRLM